MGPGVFIPVHPQSFLAVLGTQILGTHSFLWVKRGIVLHPVGILPSIGFFVYGMMGRFGYTLK